MTTRKYRLPTEIPLEEYPPPEVFINTAIELVEKAQKRGLPLRIMGGLACYIHTKGFETLWSMLGRLGERVFTDIDLAGYKKFRMEIMNFLSEQGYFTDPLLLWRHGDRRLIYFTETTASVKRVPMIDVFLDELRMNHRIPFTDRLEVDYPTIPLAELFLEKLQIVKMDEKDIKDSLMLLRAHDVGETDRDTINLKRIAELLASDWGFYYTATTNLQKIKESINKYPVFKDEDKQIISQRIEKILRYIEEYPKSLAWKMRSKIGPKKKWYEDVVDWSIGS